MTYKPVTVDVARQIARYFDKSMVIILAHDDAHGKMHTTTYGVSSLDKVQAAQLAELATAACGCDVSQARSYSDFRHVKAADNARALEVLERACDAADAALVTLLAVRDRLGHEMIQQAETARLTIDNAKRIAAQATRGDADGDKSPPSA